MVAIGCIQFPTSTEGKIRKKKPLICFFLKYIFTLIFIYKYINIAEFIYAFLNGTSIDNEDVIQLRYNKFKTNQLTPLPPSLIISNVPKQVSIKKVYSLFRKIGPIIQCALIKEQGNKDVNKVNIQYISKSDTSQALSTYHNTTIEDNVM